MQANISQQDQFWLNRVPMLIFGYFGVQIGLRFAHQGALGLDEAEILITSQQLALGYGPQPPLYSWLQAPLVWLFGPNAVSLALLKNALLITTYTSLFLLGARLGRTVFAPALAALGLLVLPQISWESQRELTHSVVGVTFSALTLLHFFRTIDQPSLRRLIGLGALAGLTLLGKYNTALFLGALLITALSTPQTSALVRQPRFLIVPAVALLVTLPHGLWMLANADALFQSSHKFGLEAQSGFVMTRLTGLASLLNATVQFSALALLLFGALLISPKPKSDRDTPAPMTGFMIRLVLTGLALVAISVLASGSTSVKDRWMQPILFMAPLAFALWIETRLKADRMKLIVRVAMGLMLLLAVAMQLNFRWGGWNKASHFSAPYPQIAFAMKVDELNPGTIIADKTWTAGNMKRAFPDAQVITPQTATLPIKVEEPVSIMWSSHKPAPPPAELAALYQKLTGNPVSLKPVRVYSVPYPVGKKRKVLSIAAYGWRENQTPPQRY